MSRISGLRNDMNKRTFYKEFFVQHIKVFSSKVLNSSCYFVNFKPVVFFFIIQDKFYFVFTNLCLVYMIINHQLSIINYQGAVARWYSQRTSVLEVAGSIPAPVIVELLQLKISYNLG